MPNSMLQQLLHEKEYLLRMRDSYMRNIEFTDKLIQDLQYKINRARREENET